MRVTEISYDSFHYFSMPSYVVGTIRIVLPQHFRVLKEQTADRASGLATDSPPHLYIHLTFINSILCDLNCFVKQMNSMIFTLYIAEKSCRTKPHDA